MFKINIIYYIGINTIYKYYLDTDEFIKPYKMSKNEK